MRSLDTNVFIRYITADETESHQAAGRLFQKILRGEETAAVLDIVIHEVCYVLSSSSSGYNLTHQDIRNRLVPIVTLPNISVIPSKDLCLEALNVFAQGEKIDFADALQVVYVRNALLDGIISFDKRMDKLEGACREDPRSMNA